MAKVSDYYPGDLPAALNRTLGWILSRLNANVSSFEGNAVEAQNDSLFIEGAMDTALGSLDDLPQVAQPNIVLDPLGLSDLDRTSGPDGFPINFSPQPVLGGNLLVNLLVPAKQGTVSGRVFNLVEPAASYRVDVYSRTDTFYFQGSSAIASDNTWSLANVHPGTVLAFLFPAALPAPQPGQAFLQVTGWVAHSNMGVGKRLRDYFVRVYAKTDLEYLQEDKIPIIVQDSAHARFGTSFAVQPGTPTAHVAFNDPKLGPVELYSTLQNLAVYSDLPRSIDVPPSDPDFAGPGLVVSSNIAYIQNRSWIYDASLAIVVLSMAGLWQAARRIVIRLNDLRKLPGYLPSISLEDAEEGSTARWALASGAGTIANIFDSSEPRLGSNVISFSATAASTAWNFVGPGLPDSADTIVDFRYKATVNCNVVIGVTSSTGKVIRIALAASGSPGYDAATGTLTVAFNVQLNNWRVLNLNLASLIQANVAGEKLTKINSFQVVLQGAGNLELDNLTLGSPQPAGSLSFSYDVYNGQVDQAYIRSGAMAWVAFAYGVYIERTGDYQTAALGLEDMLNFLFSLQSKAANLTKNLITLGWGKYEDPGYHYVPGQILSVSTEHNVDCYMAFNQAARVLPTAAQKLFNARLITQSQYDALKTTAAAAATKTTQLVSAIMDQLWIPAAGAVKGHFAQGASAAGLDTSLALDAAGYLAAVFAHEVGDDARAVSCLEFIYENFFVTNHQILKTSQTNSYNEAYEQLTPFDGFKTYADSTGGYSGSPDSIFIEGTWGAIGAYLRLRDNAGLQAYFSSNYPNGIDAFLSRLIQSMKIMGETDSDPGLLSFSLAARALPWEISVRRTLAPAAWFWLTSMLKDAPPSPFLLGPALLKIPRGVQQRIRQLDGQGSIGALEVEAIDGSGTLTALVSGGKLEGRKVSLRVGYPGMDSADFVTVATQQIETIKALPDLSGFTLECVDLKRSAKSKVFLAGDDGSPISREHPRTVIANPMDAALMVFQNELGLGQVPGAAASDWKLYDPAQWDLGLTFNPTLISPNPYVDVDGFLAYRNDIFAGYVFEFVFQAPVEAKQFLEFELFKALGGYMIVLTDGRISPRFFVPPYLFDNFFSLNERNMTALPGTDRNPIVNQVTYRMDYDGSKFQTELLFAHAPSLQQYGLAGEDIIESKGMRSARGGVSLAGLTATRIFRRYSGIDPVSQLPKGGALDLTVVSHFMTLTVEIGDFVFASHSLLPDFGIGRRGVFNRLFEAVEKQPNFAEGTMNYRLLDAGWISAKKLSRLAPQGTPAFTAASSAQQARYMFISADATQEYSDGAPGKTIF